MSRVDFQRDLADEYYDTATIMESVLEKITKTGFIHEAVPPIICKEAIGFFDLVLEEIFYGRYGVHKSAYTDPMQLAVAMVLSQNILRDTGNLPPSARESNDDKYLQEYGQIIQEYKDFITTLNKQRELNDFCKGLVKRVHIFFKDMAEKGLYGQQGRSHGEKSGYEF